MGVIRRPLEIESGLTGLPAFEDWAKTLKPQPDEDEELARHFLAQQVAGADDVLSLTIRLSILAALDQFSKNMGRVVTDNGFQIRVGDDEAADQLMPGSDLPPRAKFVITNAIALDYYLREAHTAIRRRSSVNIAEEVGYRRQSSSNFEELARHRTVISTTGQIKKVPQVWRIREPIDLGTKVSYHFPSDVTPVSYTDLWVHTTDGGEPNPGKMTALALDRARQKMKVPLIRIKGALALGSRHWNYVADPDQPADKYRRTRVSIDGQDLS